MLLATLWTSRAAKSIGRAFGGGRGSRLESAFTEGNGSMKRPVVTFVLLCTVAGLAGCPIYDHESAGC